MASVFTGNPTWLAISVRTNGAGGYAGLTPLQQLTPAPYAIFANTASNVSGTVSAAQLSGSLPVAQVSGILPLAQLPGVVVTNNQTSVTLSNLTFSGDLHLPATFGSVGRIFSGTSLFIHTYGNGAGDFFAGTGAGNMNISGSDNTGVGYQALQSLTSGGLNAAVGFDAPFSDLTGGNNTANGWEALYYNTGGNNNTANGLQCASGKPGQQQYGPTATTRFTHNVSGQQ